MKTIFENEAYNFKLEEVNNELNNLNILHNAVKKLGLQLNINDLFDLYINCGYTATIDKYITLDESDLLIDTKALKNNLIAKVLPLLKGKKVLYNLQGFKYSFISIVNDEVLFTDKFYQWLKELYTIKLTSKQEKAYSILKDMQDSIKELKALGYKNTLPKLTGNEPFDFEVYLRDI